ncbi:hypothetical protein Q0F98_34810 [Paenibacillus amylolyticus]|nr:hypothetical protein Q0F98_34810 [Paenibacillus amylolyticus]
MSHECDRLGYGLNVFVTKDKHVIMSNILGRRVDGVIIYEELRIDEQDIIAMEKDKIKAVFLDRVYQSDTMGSVIFDSYVAAYEATKYLIGLGHKKLLIFRVWTRCLTVCSVETAIWPPCVNTSYQSMKITLYKGILRRRARIVR